jgi:hypothetical protein
MRRMPTAGPSAGHRSIAEHMAREDLLGLHSDGRTNYKKVAEFLHLSKDDLAKIADVKKASVRFDANIPQPVAERLREIANIANLVAEYFKGDAHKVSLWFELSNPMLGNMSPRNMIRAGRYTKVLNFILDARDAERAASQVSESVRQFQTEQLHQARTAS